MLILNEKDIMSFYNMSQCMEDIRSMLQHKARGDIISPHRTVIESKETNGSALYMPNLDTYEKIMSMKAVTIFPDNPSVGKSTTQGVLLLSDAEDGSHLAMLNASYLTRLRTGTISALATDHLARKDAGTLLVIGTGGMAFEQVLGVLEVRAISRIMLFNPTVEKAYGFMQKLRDFSINPEIEVEVHTDVDEAVPQADIICCSTRSRLPVFRGEDIRPGTHVNGVGSYLPDMREVDFDFIQRTDKIVVDDFDGATHEAGELIHANDQDGWSYSDLHGELMDIVNSDIKGRQSDTEITFFKSVGAAYFDSAAAIGVYKEAKKGNKGTSVEI
ncbi:ornithine cyclodeaminase family protein [Salinicoccus hispanicus]|uniref:Ornithine cyclodeaminase family protein n=1 Tax=Salinicoccus hispanicus TaxID=157225 RepID=A0A6N8U853_9STAP|nr:ornithine cyclodeaminase family protein [Salinicoccus hispanicus]MXQ51829.1 ornithine cyclodeaminase family protein [Salinicoccus hispanicus]